MWIYTFIRTDIPIAQQIVQAAHSAYESGRGSPEVGYPRMVLIAIKDKEELQKALDHAKLHVECFPFYEQDLDYGLTSFTTRPVNFDERAFFKIYKLWRAENVLDLHM